MSSFKQLPVSVSLSEFRARLTECWEKIQLEIDCIYLTYHTRRAAAFVSPRLAVHLPIPISEVTNKLLTVSDETLVPETQEIQNLRRNNV
jgi:hypothetical protein